MKQPRIPSRTPQGIKPDWRKDAQVTDDDELEDDELDDAVPAKSLGHLIDKTRVDALGKVGLRRFAYKNIIVRTPHPNDDIVECSDILDEATNQWGTQGYRVSQPPMPFNGAYTEKSTAWLILMEKELG